MTSKLELEVISFLLSQYEGSGEVAEQAAMLRKKVEEDAAAYAYGISEEALRLLKQKIGAGVHSAIDAPPPAADESAAPAETGGEPVAHHVADEPLRTHPQRKRKGHA